ncbi:MAG: type II toxin-antitoxin system Phd/YefM family antitoxin [Legionella sp.]|nr:type II toxin-antitoxin system Phd/YefM family antitoxin [Legionella sp.]
MSSSVLKVGVREFRSHLPQYLLTAVPVAITRHGETVGYYIPTRQHVKQSKLDALKEAALKLEKLLVSEGISEDELLVTFRALRKEGQKE